MELEENTIIQLNLLSEDVNCNELVNEIKYCNTYYELYAKCIKKYAKKLLTKQEFIWFLNAQTKNEKIIDKIIQKLADNQIINDCQYEQEYVALYQNNLKYSSNKIANNLSAMGITLTAKNHEILQQDDLNKAITIVNKIVDKYNNKSLLELKKKSYVKLQQYMYDEQVITEAIQCINIDEYVTAKNSYLQLKRKYEQNRVQALLMKRGFSYDIIKDVMEESDD